MPPEGTRDAEGHASSPGPADASCRHICILVHGLMGSSKDWQTWVECLAERCPEWVVKPIDLREQTRPIIGKALQELADVTSQKILQVVAEAEASQPGGGCRLHCVGHSLGGLILRAALPHVHRELSGRVQMGVYMTLSTPHLGIQASWSAKADMWRNLCILAGVISAQLPQLAVQDSSGGGGRPYLMALTDQDPFLDVLASFSRRVLVTMSGGDPVIPTVSGSLVDLPWRQPQHDQHQLAGWGIEHASCNAPPQDAAEQLCGCARTRSRSCSSSSTQDTAEQQGGAARTPSCSSSSPRASDEGRAGVGRWTVSADGACSFPQRMLERLLRLPWERVVLRLHLPRANVHVFPIAKRSDQTAFEHALSRECVEFLIDLLTTDTGQAAICTTAPRWVRRVEACPRPREFCCHRWVVAVEKGVGFVEFVPFELEEEARFFFGVMSITSRVLFDPAGIEVKRGGANQPAFRTIRSHFHFPHPEAWRTKWAVLAEEGVGQITFQAFDDEAQARAYFNSFMCVIARVLFDPLGAAREQAGWNKPALKIINRLFQREYHMH